MKNLANQKIKKGGSFGFFKGPPLSGSCPRAPSTLTTPLQASLNVTLFYKKRSTASETKTNQDEQNVTCYLIDNATRNVNRTCMGVYHARNW
jgi:hypothetical protein